jgi:hypothetical protein
MVFTSKIPTFEDSSTSKTWHRSHWSNDWVCIIIFCMRDATLLCSSKIIRARSSNTWENEKNSRSEKLTEGQDYNSRKSSEVRVRAASDSAYSGYPKQWMLRYPVHIYHAVPSPGFEPTIPWLRVWRPKHSATMLHQGSNFGKWQMVKVIEINQGSRLQFKEVILVNDKRSRS